MIVKQYVSARSLPEDRKLNRAQIFSHATDSENLWQFSKKQGPKVGLGMAIVYAIVHQHMTNKRIHKKT